MQLMVSGKRARLAFELGRQAEGESGEFVSVTDGDFDVAPCTCGDEDCSGFAAVPKSEHVLVEPEFGFRA